MSIIKTIRTINARYQNPKGDQLPLISKISMKLLAWYVVIISMLIGYKFYLLVTTVAEGAK